MFAGILISLVALHNPAPVKVCGETSFEVVGKVTVVTQIVHACGKASK